MHGDIEELAASFEEAGEPRMSELLRELPLPTVESVTVLAFAWQEARGELARYRKAQSRLPDGQSVPGLAEWERAEHLSRTAYNRACSESYEG